MKIVRLDDYGRGIGYIDGKTTFVEGALPDEDVEVSIKTSKKNYNEAIVTKYLKRSSKRIVPPCPYFGKCGGCSLEHLSYEDTLEYKNKKVINYFNKLGIDIKTVVIKNDYPYNYRNKITLKVINKKIGYYEKNTHKLIEITNCLLAKESINKAIKFIKNFNIINGEVTIRSNYNDEILIIINSFDKLSIDINLLKKEIKLVGIVINNKTYYNENFFYERLNNLIFKVSFNSFFQINLNTASKLFSIIEENIDNNEVLELYSGVGALSLVASRKARKVTGVEIVKSAVIDATLSAKLNKIDNAFFLLNDATNAVSRIDIPFDTFLVDPPRSGLTKDILDYIVKKKPKKLIYVSCNMTTLARDINEIKKYYKIEKYYIVDMFSYSYHLESVCILKYI